MPLEARQLYGALILLVILGALAAGRMAGPGNLFFKKITQPNTDPRSGPTAVELTGDGVKQGVYFLPRGARVADLIAIAGEKEKGFKAGDLGRVLRSGLSVHIDRAERTGEGEQAAEVRIGGMSNALRFALDMPMGLNRASREDLLLVSGIGQKTAEAIIETRKAIGGFRTMEDLLEVKGIGPKKLEKFSRSFYMDSAP